MRFGRVAAGLAATALLTAGLVSPAHAAGSLSCTRSINGSSGTITCTSSGGSVFVKEVRFDCAFAVDSVHRNFTVDGTWSASHTCNGALTRIQVTI